MISRKLGEKDLTIAVLYILQTEGHINTSELKRHLFSLLNPIGTNLMPLENRNDTAIDQIVRNIISHRDNPSNIIGRGFVNYSNGILSITNSGIQYLRDYIENNIRNGII